MAYDYKVAEFGEQMRLPLITLDSLRTVEVLSAAFEECLPVPIPTRAGRAPEWAGLRLTEAPAHGDLIP
jgi:hypothetical protein